MRKSTYIFVLLALACVGLRGSYNPSTGGGTVGSSNVKAHKVASQTIGNGANTALTFDTNDYANGSAIHSTTVNPTRFTAPATGNYYVDCQVTWTATLAVSVFELFIRVNGTTQTFGVQGPNADSTGSDSTVQNVSAFMPLNSGDYTECMVLQRTGGNLNATTPNTFGLMWALK